jgi:hypothetical protein
MFSNSSELGFGVFVDSGLSILGFLLLVILFL